MSNLGLTKFKIVPRAYTSGHGLGDKLGSLVSSATIYNTGTFVEASIASDKDGTSGSNPVTAVDGTITFWSSAPDVDVIVTLSTGATITRSAVTATTTHKFVSDSSITMGGSVQAVGRQTANIVKSLSWSIGVSSATGVDLNFVRDSVNPSIDDEIELTNVIPAFAKIIDLQLVTTEAATNSIEIKVGSSSSGEEYHANTSMETVDTILQYASNNLGEVAATSSDGSIFIKADPTNDWDTYTAGKWRLTVTFVDFGQLI